MIAYMNMPQPPQPPPKCTLHDYNEIRKQLEYDLKVAQTTNALYRRGDEEFVVFLEQVQLVESSYTLLHSLFAKAKFELEWLSMEWKCHAVYDISAPLESARNAHIQTTNVLQEYGGLLRAFQGQCRCLTSAWQAYVKKREAIEEDHHTLLLQLEPKSFSKI